MTQSVKHLTLDFSLGHDLMVCEFEPRHPAPVQNLLGIPPLFLSLSPSHPTYSIFQNKWIKLNKKYTSLLSISGTYILALLMSPHIVDYTKNAFSVKIQDINWNKFNKCQLNEIWNYFVIWLLVWISLTPRLIVKATALLTRK